jgi:hypothetical protein
VWLDGRGAWIDSRRMQSEHGSTPVSGWCGAVRCVEGVYLPVEGAGHWHEEQSIEFIKE